MGNTNFSLSPDANQGPTVLYTSSYGAGTLTFTRPTPLAQFGGLYNAMGFNPLDGFLYGIVWTVSSSGSSPQLVQIGGPNGTVTNQGTISGPTGTSSGALPAAQRSFNFVLLVPVSLNLQFGYTSGAFDPDGNYWVSGWVTPSDATALGVPAAVIPQLPSFANQLYEINPATRRVIATRTLSGSPLSGTNNDWAPWDMTYSAGSGLPPTAPGGYMWGLRGQTGSSSNPPTIWRLNTSNGQITTFNISSVLTTANVPSSVGGNYGAAWTLINGNLAFANNNGTTSTAGAPVVQIAVTNPSSASPTFRLVSRYTTLPTTVNDGAQCIPNRAYVTNLSIMKDGPATVTPGGRITWTLTVRNNGPDVSSGFAVNDTLPAGVTGVATTTPGCTVTGQLVQCAEGRLDVNQTFSITITGNAPTTGCVTNGDATVSPTTVQGNEQPTPAESNTVQTCVAVPAAPSLLLRKTATCGEPPPAPCTSVSGAGDTINYQFTVTNTGGETITGITVTDTPTAPSTGSRAPPNCMNITSLAPGASMTCTSSYTVSGADVTNGVVLDTAIANGTASGVPIASNPYSVAVDVRPTQPHFTSIIVNTSNDLLLVPPPAPPPPPLTTVTFNADNPACVATDPGEAYTAYRCTFHVPLGVTDLMVDEIAGGTGGKGSTGTGRNLGGGAAVLTNKLIPVAQDSDLTVIVAGRGANGSSSNLATSGQGGVGFGNGGTGGLSNSQRGGGGGAGSAICTSPCDSTNALIVAGGGAGGGGGNSATVLGGVGGNAGSPGNPGAPSGSNAGAAGTTFSTTSQNGSNGTSGGNVLPGGGGGGGLGGSNCSGGGGAGGGASGGTSNGGGGGAGGLSAFVPLGGPCGQVSPDRINPILNPGVSDTPQPGFVTITFGQ